MYHVVLCGDSVFDNRAYVGDEPDVATQLQQRLPEGSQSTLLARDGEVLEGLRAQFKRLPDGATHLFISAGGNDALGFSGSLQKRTGSFAELVSSFAAIAGRFEEDYQRMLDGALALNLPTAVCSIYYPKFDMEDSSRLEGFDMPSMDLEERREFQRLAVTALSVLNDVILRKAFAAGIPLLDLRLICSENADYANPIEPSAAGGAKIADAVFKVLQSHDFGRKRTEVFV